MADFDPPFAHANGSKRMPTSGEIDDGFGCGPADMNLFNGLMHAFFAELGGLIGKSGFTPSNADMVQVARAVRSHALNYRVPGGSANALTLTLDPVPASWNELIGTPLIVKIATTNTGATTLAVTGLAGTRPLVSFSGAALQRRDLMAGKVVTLVYDGTNVQVLGFSPSNLLVVPPSNTFYVSAATGNDANDGLTNGTAFATLQGAVDAIVGRYVTLEPVTLQVASGVYGGVSFGRSLVPNWVLSGTSATIDATSLGVNAGRGIRANTGVNVSVSGFTIASAYEAVSCQGGRVDLSSCTIAMPTIPNVGAIVAYSSGVISVTGTINISGSGDAVFVATNGGSLNLGYVDAVNSFPLTVNNSSVTVTSAFAVAAINGVMPVFPSVVSFTGSVTGNRYLAALNGVINTGGASSTFFPGTVAGSTTTGGQYA